MHVAFAGDDTLIPPQVRIERVRALVPSDLPPAVTQDARQGLESPADHAASVADDVPDEDDVATESEDGQDDAAAAAPAEGAVDAEAERRRRRRRRRRGGRREEGAPVGEPSVGTAGPAAEAVGGDASIPPADLAEHIEGVPEYADAAPGIDTLDNGAGDAGAPSAEAADEAARSRRRGRRGGRRRRQGADAVLEPVAAPGAEQPELPPLYTGPTPANPFGGQAFDIFDAIEQAEQAVDRSGAGRPIVRSAEPVSERAPEPMPAPLVEMAQEHAPELVMEPVSADAAPLFIAISEPSIDIPSVLVPANDAVPEPLIKPIVIGAEEDASVVEKKRGWWRR
jgi:ribonuclease E